MRSLVVLACVLAIVVGMPPPQPPQGGSAPLITPHQAGGHAMRYWLALPAGWTMTQWGPLTPADKDVLVRVKQAGLWERPSGLWAQTMASSQRVKEVGAQLAADHLQLDVSVEAVAKKLGVTLPQQPTAEQAGWMQEEKTAKTPQDFDRIFTERLRAAHGKVFTIIAATRSGTRNDLIRQFAQVGINVVMKHMTLLESTSLVNYNDWPTPAAPAGG